MGRRCVAALAVALVAFLAHVSVLGGGYTFDDHAIVEENPRLAVHDLTGLRELLASNWWGPSGERSGERLYRPLPLATYALERAAGGGPRTSHVTNALLHALAAALALAVFREVAAERAAVLGALVFAAHPLHAEAVGGIVGRAEVLAAACGLGALVLHRRGARAAEALALFLALASKESAIAVLPIAVAIDLALDGRLRVARYAAPVLALVVYVGTRALAIGSLVARSGARTLGDMPLPGRSLYALAVLRDAWGDVLFPVHGTAAHFPLPDTSAGGLAVAALVQAGVVAAAALGLSRLARRPLPALGERTARSVALGAVGFEFALFPVLNLVPIGVVYAERLLYGPSVWASLVVGALGARFTKRPAGPWLAGLLVGALAFGSLRNERAWRDDLALWETTVRRFPQEPRARLALGEALLARGAAREAVAHVHFACERFEDTQPLKAKAFVRLAQALLAVAPRDPRVRAEIERSLARAEALGPTRADVWLARAELEERNDRPELAVAAAQRACALEPESYDARWNLGFALIQTRDLAGAERELTAALRLSPTPGEASFNRATARWELGDRAGALADYEQAARFLVAKGNAGQAREALEGVRERIPAEEWARIAPLLAGP